MVLEEYSNTSRFLKVPLGYSMEGSILDIGSSTFIDSGQEYHYK